MGGVAGGGGGGGGMAPVGGAPSDYNGYGYGGVQQLPKLNEGEVLGGTESAGGGGNGWYRR